MDLKSRISEIIGIKADDIPASIEYRIIESIKEAGYTRQLIEYNSNGDTVIAFLLIPEVLNNNPAILINHRQEKYYKYYFVWSVDMNLRYLLKKICLIGITMMFVLTIFLYLTPPGKDLRISLAKTIVITRYQEYVWIFVGEEKGKELIKEFHERGIKDQLTFNRLKNFK